MNLEKIFDFFNLDDYKDLDKESENHQYYEKQKEEVKKANIKQYSLEEFIKTIKNSKNFSFFKENLKNIKQEFLYQSPIHGITHNIRVSFFTFFLAEKLKLSVKDLKLALYAAFYHDIGRRNDDVDDAHGSLSALKLDKLQLNIDEEESNILKCIITAHSLSDKVYEKVVNKYKIKDLERCKLLYQILKDSDALDRVRLELPYIGLNYLRVKTSLSLITTSYQLEYNFKLNSIK